jgi:hypothetical protein
MSKKAHIIKLNNSTAGCIWEAMRRHLYLHHGNESDIGSDLLGLGHHTEYKQAIEAGLMKVSYPPEIKREINWYKLTSLGQQVAKQLIRRKIVPESCQDVAYGWIPEEIKVYVNT